MCRIPIEKPYLTTIFRNHVRLKFYFPLNDVHLQLCCLKQNAIAFILL